MDFHSRDIQILRQSQSKMALEYTNSVGVKITVEELQRITVAKNMGKESEEDNVFFHFDF